MNLLFPLKFEHRDLKKNVFCAEFEEERGGIIPIVMAHANFVSLLFLSLYMSLSTSVIMNKVFEMYAVVVQVSEKLNPLLDANNINHCPDGAPHIHKWLLHQSVSKKALCYHKKNGA